jgi:glutathione S-transferase
VQHLANRHKRIAAMTWDYVDFEDAVAADGLRMTVVSQVPSPWGEAAKGIFHVKGLNWSAVRLDPMNRDMTKWARGASAPAVMNGKEAPRSGATDILLLAERLAPEPALLPSDPMDRALALGMAHEFCGEGGLGWARRLHLTHLGLNGQGGFVEPVAQYLAQKYGYSEQAGAAAHGRVIDLLTMFAGRLAAQQAKGSDYFFDCGMTAVDIYAATFAGLLQPLPEEVCAMRSATRAAFSTVDDETLGAAGGLLAHRDMMYERWLEGVLRL